MNIKAIYTNITKNLDQVLARMQVMGTLYTVYAINWHKHFGKSIVMVD